MKKDLYSTLGVDKNATQEDIKNTYRERAKNSHPDKGGSSEKMAEINNAYRVLSDPRKRETYDKTGEEHDQPFQEKFIAFVNSMFMIIVNNSDNVNSRDLISEFKGGIQATIEQLQKNKKNALKQIKKLSNVKSRIKSKNDKTITSILTSHIDGHVKSVNAIEKEILFIQECQKVLEEYGYDFDNIQPSDMKASDFRNFITSTF